MKTVLMTSVDLVFRFFTDLNRHLGRGKKIILSIFLIAITGCALRFFNWYADPWQRRDSIYYLEKVETISGTEKDDSGYTSGPLLICLLRFFHKSGLDYEKSGTLLQIILGTLLVISVAAISWNITRYPLCVLFSSLFACWHVSLIEWSTAILKENLYLTGMLFSIWFMLIGCKKRKNIWWWLSGVFGALAFFSRLEGLEIILVYLLVSSFFCRTRNELLQSFGWIVSFCISCCSLLQLCDWRLEYIFRGIWERLIYFFKIF